MANDECNDEPDDEVAGNVMMSNERGPPDTTSPEAASNCRLNIYEKSDAAYVSAFGEAQPPANVDAQGKDMMMEDTNTANTLLMLALIQTNDHTHICFDQRWRE